MLDVNLEKLVPLKIHDRFKIAKIENKYFPMSKWGMPYTVQELKRRAFQQDKDLSILSYS